MVIVIVGRRCLFDCCGRFDACYNCHVDLFGDCSARVFKLPSLTASTRVKTTRLELNSVLNGDSFDYRLLLHLLFQ